MSCGNGYYHYLAWVDVEMISDQCLQAGIWSTLTQSTSLSSQSSPDLTKPQDTATHHNLVQTKTMIKTIWSTMMRIMNIVLGRDRVSWKYYVNYFIRFTSLTSLGWGRSQLSREFVCLGYRHFLKISPDIFITYCETSLNICQHSL